ncbi:hypothetical protein [Streptomyces sp. NPDC086519]|uniref:hypothetical protein n=1 Tax=Streptomyces sp. NPDC086519 TaxID=3154863 RepID=UPI0034359B64
MSQNSNEPRESLAPRVREDQAAAGSRSVATVAQPAGRAQQERRPGGWPVSIQAIELRNEFQRERARKQLILDSIRAHLSEQPSDNTIRSCARRWTDDIRRLADDIIAAHQEADA